MNSTIPTDLLELKGRFETWRTNRGMATIRVYAVHGINSNRCHTPCW